MKELLQEVKQLLEEAEIDCNKCCNGNKAAGVRFRKKIKQTQVLLKELRATSLRDRE